MKGGKKFHSLVVWTLQEKSLLRSQKLVDMEQGSFILSLFQEQIFTRNIMTKALGYQKDTFNTKCVPEYRSLNHGS